MSSSTLTEQIPKKYEIRGQGCIHDSIKSPQQLGVDGNDGPREAEGLEGACWGVCGLWIVEQGDERDALVALLVCHCEFWLTNVWNRVIRVLPRVYQNQSCVFVCYMAGERHVAIAI